MALESTLGPIADGGTRGTNFSAQEDFALAQAWLKASRSIYDQNIDVFSAAVADTFSNNGTVGNRSPNSLKSRWTTVQRVTQKYLAVDKLYRAHIPSGESEEDTLNNIMMLYRDMYVTVMDGGKKRRRAPVIKFLETVMLLSKHPKFSTVIGGVTAAAPSNNAEGGDVSCGEGSAVSTTSSEVGQAPSGAAVLTSPDEKKEIDEPKKGNISKTTPGYARPIGAKKRKQDSAVKAGVYKMAKSIDGVSRAIRMGSQSKVKLASVALRYKIISNLDIAAEQKNKMMLELLEQSKHFGDDDSESVGGNTNNSPSGAESVYDTRRDEGDAPHTEDLD